MHHSIQDPNKIVAKNKIEADKVAAKLARVTHSALNILCGTKKKDREKANEERKKQSSY